MSLSFRGYPACRCLVRWLPRYEAELLARGLIKQSIDIYQLIGDAKDSAGTHANGGFYDIVQRSREAIFVARQMGAFAFDRSGPPWDPEHQHGGLRGCPHNGNGRYQDAALLAGFNGLGENGRGGKDTGPRDFVVRTWEQGIVWHKENQKFRRRQAKLERLRKRRAKINAAIVAVKKLLRRD